MLLYLYGLPGETHTTVLAPGVKNATVLGKTLGRQRGYRARKRPVWAVFPTAGLTPALLGEGHSIILPHHGQPEAS